MKKTDVKLLFFAVIVPLFIGGLATLITMGGMRGYAEFTKPPLAPPAWLFPIAWTFLYILMGIASYLVLKSDASFDEKRKSLLLYAVQLLFNFLWPVIFFGLRLYGLAFLWLIALFALVALTALSFFKANKLAGILMVPYFLWLTFAAYLNLMIAILN